LSRIKERVIVTNEEAVSLARCAHIRSVFYFSVSGKNELSQLFQYSENIEDEGEQDYWRPQPGRDAQRSVSMMNGCGLLT
jgi:hypothetical protein